MTMVIVAAALAIADPSLDLANPLKGPFRTIATGGDAATDSALTAREWGADGIYGAPRALWPRRARLLHLATAHSLIERGIVKVGDEIEIVGLRPNQSTIVTGVEMFRKLLDEGVAGDNIGVLLRGLEKDDVERGQVLAKPGAIKRPGKCSMATPGKRSFKALKSPAARTTCWPWASGPTTSRPSASYKGV